MIRSSILWFNGLVRGYNEWHLSQLQHYSTVRLSKEKYSFYVKYMYKQKLTYFNNVLFSLLLIHSKSHYKQCKVFILVECTVIISSFPHEHTYKTFDPP